MTQLTQATSNQLAFPVAQGGDLKTFNEVASGSNYFPRLQLFTSQSKPCKSGAFPVNHYGLVRSKDQMVDLGVELFCIPLSYRFKAMDTTTEPVIVSFDPHSETFAQLREKSDIKDSGCVFGVEFLVWIPSEATYATLYLNSKTSRKEGDNVRLLLGKSMKLGSRFIETKKFSWQAIVALSSPIEVESPDHEEAAEAVNRFLSEKPTEVELAAPETERAR